MPILIWLVLVVGAANAFMRPITAQLELEEDREFFQQTVVEIDIPRFGRTLVTKEVASRLRRGELTQDDLGALELGKRRYRTAKERGML